MTTSNPCYNSGRMLLTPESENCRLSLELTRGSSGMRLYLNILFLQAPPCPEDPSRTLIEVELGDEPVMMSAYILEGGQRLLIPGEEADRLIESLSDGLPFTIKFGRHTLSIIPANFSEVYQELLALPIAGP
jgi:hypothetical protein